MLNLRLSPDPIQFDAISGATRGLSFKVQNLGSDPIVVDASVATPKVMQGAVGSLGTGEDFSLAGWCAEPLTGVLIKGGEERTLRMLAVIPDADLKNPSYYGELNVVAKTQEGLSDRQREIADDGEPTRRFSRPIPRIQR